MYLTQSLLLLAHSGQDSVVRSIVELQISLNTCDHHRSSYKNIKLLLQQQQKALIITAITEACCC
jgi:hypothetical protein